MAAGAADGFFRYIYDGCLSGGDMGIEHRPYHRNCSCALHKENCPNRTAQLKNKNVKYPIRRSWSEGSLLAASCHSSPSSSPSSVQLPEAGKTSKAQLNGDLRFEFH